MYMHMHVYACICMHMHMYAHACICMHMHTYLYIYVYIHVCIYMHICRCADQTHPQDLQKHGSTSADEKWKMKHQNKVENENGKINMEIQIQK